MKIAAFNGSPRTEGNTEILLHETLRSIDETVHRITVFKLNKMDIKPCQDCGGCETTGECVIRDEMEGVYDAIRQADRIIVASPIFFFALSAQTKIMIDRCQPFWCTKYILKRDIPAGIHGRKGLLLLVGGMEKEIGIRCGEATGRAFFRTISVPQHETVTCTGIDKKGAILDHPGVMREAYLAGQKLITS